MENQKKCSAKKHSDINAISYCIECNIYMCNKCISHHSEIHENHHNYNLDKNMQEIFTGICKEEKHKQELEFYCKTHSKLCCAACISKIKEKGNGQHTDCNVCLIEEIKDEKKNKLNGNIKTLEEISNKIEDSINKLKQIFQKINEDKEKLKLDISKIFTKIRNTLNEREDELLLEIDNKYNNLFFTEKLINQIDKLPNEIKISLEKGRKINGDWNDGNKINKKIQDCLDIENNINNINEINKKIEKCNSAEIKTKIVPENENELNEFLKTIKIFGKIIFEIIEVSDDFIFKFKPGKNYSVSNNGLIAKKTSGGDCWNCTIIGDKEIPKNKISKWKIKINNFEIKYNTANILIGIGPNNPNNKNNFYDECWSFICGESMLSLKSGVGTNYNNNKNEKLKKGDIIEVIVDRKAGTLSFSINDSNYGTAYSQIPKDDILYPIVMINDENQIVELLQSV